MKNLDQALIEMAELSEVALRSVSASLHMLGRNPVELDEAIERIQNLSQRILAEKNNRPLTLELRQQEFEESSHLEPNH